MQDPDRPRGEEEWTVQRKGLLFDRLERAYRDQSQHKLRYYPREQREDAGANVLLAQEHTQVLLFVQFEGITESEDASSKSEGIPGAD